MVGGARQYGGPCAEAAEAHARVWQAGGAHHQEGSRQLSQEGQKGVTNRAEAHRAEAHRAEANRACAHLNSTPLFSGGAATAAAAAPLCGHKDVATVFRITRELDESNDAC